ncbi:PD-(D/E)XK nuclease family protein [Streptomyces sp. NPDC017529]|uniref:PD-(D/E)XK nuclease family protein n=1 Tax=Streptomyces sp. NPDC017529 TaxID=3365000 RepID=UPI0037AEA292
MVDSWLPPDGVHRVSDTITVSVGKFKGGEFRCPAADALKARSYRPSQPATRSREPLEHFALGPFMAACDARLDRGLDGEKRPAAPLHDGLRQWTEHALTTYDNAFPADPDQPLVEIMPPWIYRHRPLGRGSRAAQEYRLTVWGRCLRSAEGRVRELRLPVNRLNRQAPPDGFVAAAALVLAEGTPGPPPERVRIIEFALLDGQVRLLFDGTRTEALARYREHGSSALADILDSQEYRPGASCAECPYASVCPALRKSPGLLGVETHGRTRRTWSVTNGRNYRACPARDHLRRLHLPTEDAVERDPTAERGRALHAYLAQRHSHGPLRPCTGDVPEHWVPDGFDLPEDERVLGARLLRHHATVCPLRCVQDATDVRTEPRVVRHDTTADVMVIAAPDLLYRDGDSWVWRETKTSAANRRSSRSLLATYPQLALAVLLTARGDLGGGTARARVELEVLRPGGADLEIIDPFALVRRTEAERIIRGLVTDWHTDDWYTATPGRACARCEVARWCSVSLANEAAA